MIAQTSIHYIFIGNTIIPFEHSYVMFVTLFLLHLRLQACHAYIF